jgi:serine/threonine-protein kinase
MTSIIRHSRFSIRKTLDLLCQLAEGLAAIHRSGIVHRDLKPDNILLTADGRVKISDFGVACADGEDCASEGMLIGTPRYVAPEYIESGSFDRRSDIYALGVIAYELIAGHCPFRSATRDEVILERFERGAASLYAVCPECPSALVRIVEKAMSISVDERYQSAEEMLADLRLVEERRCARKISEEIDRGLLQRVRSVNQPKEKADEKKPKARFFCGKLRAQ